MRLFFFIPFLFLMGCAVPKVTIPEAKPLAWWSHYEQNSVKKLVKITLKQSYDVQDLAYDVALARINLADANYDFWPSVSMSNFYERGQSSNVRFPGAQVGSFRYRIAHSSLDSSYELDLFGQIRTRVEANKKLVESMLYTMQDLKQLITKDAIAQYLQLGYANFEVKKRRDVLNAHKQLLKIARDKYRIKQIRRGEVNAVKTRLNSAKAGYAAAKMSRRLLINNIEYLTRGKKFTDLQKVSLPNFQKLDFPKSQVASRPDIRALEAKAAAEKLKIKEAKKEFLPKFSFNGSIGFESGDLSQFVNVFNFGPRFSWLPFDTGRVSNLIKGQEITYEKAVNLLKQGYALAAKEIKDGHASIDASFAQYKFSKQNAQLSRQDYRQVKLRYEVGTASLEEFLSAKLEKLERDISAKSAFLQLHLDNIKLIRAYGG